MRETIGLLTLTAFVLELTGCMVMAYKLWPERKTSRFAAWWGRVFSIYFIGDILLVVAFLRRGIPSPSPLDALIYGFFGRAAICLSIWICVAYLAGRLNGHK